MKAITELSLRQQFKKGIPESITLKSGQILTPSAAQFLKDKGVQWVLSGKNEPEAKGELKQASLDKNPPGYEPQERYISAGDGGRFTAKPEHMTQLKGKLLVPKDHPRIAFRGKLDSLQSQILLLQHTEKDNQTLFQDLGEVLAWTREILKSEVLDEELKKEMVLGLSDTQLRQQSHQPKKYFKCGHIFPTADMSRTMLELNRLRTEVRSVELSAIRAFTSEYRVERSDILQALNRMSSAVYIMMLRLESKVYSQRGNS